MTNGEERGRILRMVSEGKLTPSEAEELLAALTPDPALGMAVQPRPSLPPLPPMPPVPPARRHSLVIQVYEGEKSKVNLRIPLGLARAAGRFIPRQAQQRLDEFDINLEQLLQSLHDGESGTLLEVIDGKDHIHIAVE